ncbi:hypothetical protein TNCV_756841 [Trichonephila clavipes]|nr:hypothetical protein TNCV_756841 [Trichonephila clavipes]
MSSSQHDCNEEEIGKERSKTHTSYVLTNNEAGGVENWYYRYFSNYDRIIRLVAWILRLKHKCKNVTGKKHGELTVTEFQEAAMKSSPFRACYCCIDGCFLMAFRRFVARRGRCATVYCDNSTNFVGAANYLKQLNWSGLRPPACGAHLLGSALATSSKELSGIGDSHSTDDANSTVAHVRNTIEGGCLTKIHGKKTEHFYEAEIMDVKEHYSVKFLKNSARSNKFLYDKEEMKLKTEILCSNCPNHHLLKLQSDTVCSSLL